MQKRIVQTVFAVVLALGVLWGNISPAATAHQPLPAQVAGDPGHGGTGGG